MQNNSITVRSVSKTNKKPKDFKMTLHLSNELLESEKISKTRAVQKLP